MRFSSRLSGFLLVALLCGCTLGAPDLPPNEVLKRSVIKSHSVNSVSIAVASTFQTQGQKTLSGSMIIQGVLRAGGRVWSADTAFDIESKEATGSQYMTGRAVFISPGTGLQYLRIESLEGELGAKIKALLNTSSSMWWVTGTPKDNTDSEVIRAPDPAILEEYVNAIQIVDDLGIAKLEDKTKAYHYKVTLKPEVLAVLDPDDVSAGDFIAEGELWINAKDFSLRRAIWDLSNVESEAGTVDIHADINFSNFNKAPQITEPNGSIETLPLESIFAIFSASSLVPLE